MLVNWQFSGPYGVTKYGSGWRKDVVNQCLEFAEDPHYCLTQDAPDSVTHYCLTQDGPHSIPHCCLTQDVSHSIPHYCLTQDVSHSIPHATQIDTHHLLPYNTQTPSIYFPTLHGHPPSTSLQYTDTHHLLPYNTQTPTIYFPRLHWHPSTIYISRWDE